MSPFTRLFITSRDYLELEESFPGIMRIRIKAHDDDVRKFVEAGFESNENIYDLASKDQNLKRDIIDCICEKSAGM